MNSEEEEESFLFSENNSHPGDGGVRPGPTRLELTNYYRSLPPEEAIAALERDELEERIAHKDAEHVRGVLAGIGVPGTGASMNAGSVALSQEIGGSQPPLSPPNAARLSGAGGLGTPNRPPKGGDALTSPAVSGSEAKARYAKGEVPVYSALLLAQAAPAPVLALPAVNEARVARFRQQLMELLGARANGGPAVLPPLPESYLDDLQVGNPLRDRLIGLSHWRESTTAQLLSAAAVDAAALAGGAAARRSSLTPLVASLRAVSAEAAEVPILPNPNGFQILLQGTLHPLYWDVLSTLITFFVVDGFAHDQFYTDVESPIELAKAILSLYPDMPNTYKQKIKEKLAGRMKSDTAGKAILEVMYQELMAKLGFETAGEGVAHYFPYESVGDAAVLLKGWAGAKTHLAITIDSVTGQWADFLAACRVQFPESIGYTSSVLEDGDPASKKGFNAFGPSTVGEGKAMLESHTGNDVDLYRTDDTFEFKNPPEGAAAAAAAAAAAEGTQKIPRGALGIVSAKSATFGRRASPPGTELRDAPMYLRAVLEVEFTVGGAPTPVELEVLYDYRCVSIESMRTLPQSLAEARGNTFNHTHGLAIMTVTILTGGVTFAHINGNRENKVRFYVAVQGLKTNGDSSVVKVGAGLFPDITYRRYINQGRSRTARKEEVPPQLATTEPLTLRPHELAFLQFTFDKIARQLNEMMAASLGAEFHAKGFTLRRGRPLEPERLTAANVEALVKKFNTCLKEFGDVDTISLFQQRQKILIPDADLSDKEKTRAKLSQYLTGMRDRDADRGAYNTTGLLSDIKRYDKDLYSLLTQIRIQEQTPDNQIRILAGLLSGLDTEIEGLALPAPSPQKILNIEIRPNRLSAFGSAVRSQTMERVNTILEGFFPQPPQGGSVLQAILCYLLKEYNSSLTSATVENALHSDQFLKPFDVLTAQNYRGFDRIFGSKHSFMDALASLDTGKLSSDSSLLGTLLHNFRDIVPASVGIPAQRKRLFDALVKFYKDLKFRESVAANAAGFTVLAYYFAGDPRVRGDIDGLKQVGDSEEVPEPTVEAPIFESDKDIPAMASKLFTLSDKKNDTAVDRCCELVLALLADNSVNPKFDDNMKKVGVDIFTIVAPPLALRGGEENGDGEDRGGAAGRGGPEGGAGEESYGDDEEGGDGRGGAGLGGYPRAALAAARISDIPLADARRGIIEQIVILAGLRGGAAGPMPAQIEEYLASQHVPLTREGLSAHLEALQAAARPAGGAGSAAAQAAAALRGDGGAAGRAPQALPGNIDYTHATEEQQFLENGQTSRNIGGYYEAFQTRQAARIAFAERFPATNLVAVDADGNCLFRALAIARAGRNYSVTLAEVRALRNQAAEILEKEFLPALEEYETRRAGGADIEKELTGDFGLWLGNLDQDLQFQPAGTTRVNFLKTQITLLKGKGDQRAFWGGQLELLALSRLIPGGLALRFAGPDGPAPTGTTIFYIAEARHYDVILVPPGGAASGRGAAVAGSAPAAHLDGRAAQPRAAGKRKDDRLVGASAVGTSGETSGLVASKTRLTKAIEKVKKEREAVLVELSKLLKSKKKSLTEQEIIDELLERGYIQSAKPSLNDLKGALELFSGATKKKGRKIAGVENGEEKNGGLAELAEAGNRGAAALASALGDGMPLEGSGGAVPAGRHLSGPAAGTRFAGQKGTREQRQKNKEEAAASAESPAPGPQPRLFSRLAPPLNGFEVPPGGGEENSGLAVEHNNEGESSDNNGNGAGGASGRKKRGRSAAPSPHFDLGSRGAPRNGSPSLFLDTFGAGTPSGLLAPAARPAAQPQPGPWIRRGDPLPEEAAGEMEVDIDNVAPMEIDNPELIHAAALAHEAPILEGEEIITNSNIGYRLKQVRKLQTFPRSIVGTIVKFLDKKEKIPVFESASKKYFVLVIDPRTQKLTAKFIIYNKVKREWRYKNSNKVLKGGARSRRITRRHKKAKRTCRTRYGRNATRRTKK
jgi:hypothetical protein